MRQSIILEILMNPGILVVLAVLALAQPALALDVGRTLRYAVWQHGAAADALSARQRNWTVEDLVGELGNVN